jgi:hypothetical protein
MPEAKMTPPGWKITLRETGQSVDVYGEKPMTAYEAAQVAGPRLGNPPFFGVDCEALPPKAIEPDLPRKRARRATRRTKKP